MKRLSAQLLAIAITAYFTQAASRHAFLDKSEPKVGATLATAPTEVKIYFTEDIQADKSDIQVFDAAGNRIDKKDSHPDPKDESILIVSLAALSPGTYKVVWHALCPDSHKTTGDYKFILSVNK